MLVAAAAAAAGWSGYRAWTARRVSQETEKLAAVLRLGPTNRIADIGAGNGAFTIALASHVVSKGHVYATDIDEKTLETLRANAADAGLENVTVIQARADSSALPVGCCDAAFLRDVYHHITNPAATNVSVRDALRPGGRLAIIDFEPSWFLSTFFPVRDGPVNRSGHGVPPEVVIAELEGTGFRLVDEMKDWGRGQYCLVFEKPSGGW
jgi:ubiquinone/menaquinone biosynthesis C-methylase UbiE